MKDEQTAISPVTIAGVIDRRLALRKFVNDALREGVDYGKIPGVDRPALLKPGAEKILQLLNCAVELDVTVRESNPSTGYLYIEFVARARHINTGAIIGYGVGSCSSYESKYRWRWEYWQGRDAPPEGEGWQRTKHGWRRRVENTDLLDTWNTVLKMAKKRALVDLALTVSGASDLFTQDIDEYIDEDTPGPSTPPPPPPPPESPKQSSTPSMYGKRTQRPLPPDETRAMLMRGVERYAKYANEAPSSEQLGFIVTRLNEAVGGDDNRHLLLDYLFGVASSKELSKAQCLALSKWLIDDNGELIEDAVKEANACVDQARQEAGQMTLV